PHPYLPSFPTRRSSDLTLVITSGSPSGALQIESRQYDAQNEVITDTVSGPATGAQTSSSAYDHDGQVEDVQAPTGDVTFNEYDRSEEHTSELQSRFDLV